MMHHFFLLIYNIKYILLVGETLPFLLIAVLLIDVIKSFTVWGSKVRQ